MKNRERMFVYAMLAVLAAGNVIALLNSTGSAAFAETLAQLEGLGPAESLTLAQADDPEKTIELRNRDGRLSWSEEAYDRAYSMAMVHVGKPLAGLLTSEQYQQPMTELREELSAEARDRDEELRGLAQQLQGMDQNDPNFADLRRRFDQLRQQFQQWNAEAQQKVARLDAEMLLKAYDEVVAAVEVVAERRNIDIVLRFLPLELDDQTQIVSPDQAQSVIRGRTALKYPEAIDITNAIMEELALEVE